LESMGHDIEVVNEPDKMGRGQIIWRMENGVYCGASESRCDSAIACL